MDRRAFIQNAAAMATAAAVAHLPTPHVASRAAARKVGLIGTGWYGKVDLLHLLQVEPVEVVSLCDVDSLAVAAAAELFQSRQASRKRPQIFSDYRKQLAEVEHDLIIVGTPDHWHALPTIAALHSGADVFCEKPTAVDVLESKAMLDTARETGRTLQIGTQRRRLPHILEAKHKIVAAGLLGDIAQVELRCYFHMRDRRTIEQCPDEQPPENLDFEMWTGPAPLRPYNKIMHPKSWRAFTEFGNGIVGDMCVHVFDMARWLLDLGWPDSITSTGGIHVDTAARANISDTQNAIFRYPDLDMVWTHRSWGNPPEPDYQWGAVIYGSQGTLKISFEKFEFTPRGNGSPIQGNSKADMVNFPDDAKDKAALNVDAIGALGSRALMKDWLDAIDNQTKPLADIETAHLSTAVCLLANLSMKLERTVHFDPATHTIANDEQANQLLLRPYREPWLHPALKKSDL